LLSETLYVLCGKIQSGALTPATHALALNLLQNYLPDISPTPNGDFSLAARAEAIRQGYGCSRSADGLYIALAEALTQQGPTELLTFDRGMVKQAAQNAPTVKVNLLIP
jgi:predicted nucleic acid-binding protein